MRGQTGTGRPFASLDRSHVPLAWRSLTADWKRLARAVAGIGFAACLMLMQSSFKDAFVSSALQVIEALDGEVFLVAPTKYTFTNTDGFPHRRLEQAEADSAVSRAGPLYAEQAKGLWRDPRTAALHAVQVLAFDPASPVFRIPQIEAHRRELLRPDTVLVDSRARGFLGFGDAPPGTLTELAGRAVEVVGAFPLGPDFVTVGTIVTSDRTFLSLFSERANGVSILENVEVGVLKLVEGADPDIVAARLEQRLSDDVRVLTREGFIALETRFQLEVSNVGPIFLLGVAIGFAVGILISYQIMFNELSEQMPQFATLKAMGYETSYLLGVVLQQSVFYALVAFVPALAVASLACSVVGDLALLPLAVTPATAATCGLLTLVMCVLAGCLSFRRVAQADPAELY